MPTLEPTGDLFAPPQDATRPGKVPLAERMRPRDFDDLVGQDEVVGPGRPLRNAIERDELSVVSTDHCPFRFDDQKSLGKDDFTKIPNGLPCIEERMSLMSTGAQAGRVDWNRIVELTATRLR